jgi:hypothetical protein
MPHCAAQIFQTPRFLPDSERNRYASKSKEERVRVEVLYFFGCPNHGAAVDCVREVLAQEDTPAELVEVEVKDLAAAQRIGFPGSPTVRVDGQDVEPGARAEQAFGLSCRTYIYGGRRAGVPPLEWIRAAVREAKGRLLL